MTTHTTPSQRLADFLDNHVGIVNDADYYHPETDYVGPTWALYRMGELEHPATQAIDRHYENEVACRTEH